MEQQNAWGNPGPIGLGALGLVCVIFGLMMGGYMAPANTAVAVAMLLAGAVAQIITGVVDLKRGDTIGGCLMATFGCLFMLGPGLTFLFVLLKLGIPAPTMGYVNIYLGILLGVYMIPFVRVPMMMFIIAPIGMVVLVMVGLAELGYHEFAQPASIGFFVFTAWAFYMAAASLAQAVGINIPLGKPLAPLKKVVNTQGPS